MDPDSSFLQNSVHPSIAPPPLAEERKDGLSLPETEVPTSVIFGDTSVTLDGTIPKALKQAYTKSFVSIPKPEILDVLSQKQLLQNAETIKRISETILEDEQVTLASQVLADNQKFLEAAQQHYKLYLAPGAIHQEQTNQNVPTLNSELQEEKNAEELKISFTTVQQIAMKALVFT